MTAPPPSDVFRPPPGQTFSNGEVNRAGQLLRQFFHEDRKEPDIPLWDEWDSDAIVGALETVTWWKRLHARPLSRTAAALRYHVRKSGGEVNGKVEVTQRLKKRDTIIDKLERFPKMDLTQMHDIGGVRARLPSLGSLLAVSRRLRKTWQVKKTETTLRIRKTPVIERSTTTFGKAGGSSRSSFELFAKTPGPIKSRMTGALWGPVTSSASVPMTSTPTIGSSARSSGARTPICPSATSLGRSSGIGMQRSGAC